MQALPHDPRLLARLEEAQRLGFLGPGPVDLHIDHTAAFLTALEGTQGTVVDLGSGGGVPGLVLAVARPDLQIVLVEARAKRCRFLEHAIEALGVRAEVVEGRAEVVGRGPHRGAADAVVARSFGVPATTAECASPLLRVGGLLVVSEPPPPAQPGRWPVEGLANLGLEAVARVSETSTVQVLAQRNACPATFPRRDGLPAKRPLF